MKPLVIGIGEVLWDLLPSGPRMGGAPANFSCHARALGADSMVVSCIGDDDAGHRLLGNLRDLGLPVAGVLVDPSHPTGSVAVNVLEDGQPTFVIAPDVAWDHLSSNPDLEALFSRADAVCFGSLAQRSPASAETIRGLVSRVPLDSFRVFDVNLRQDYFSAEIVESSLELANVLKINDAELPQVAEMLGIRGSVHECMGKLVSRFDLRLVALTRGAEGSILFDGSEWCEHPGISVEVSDTIGAGDSFTAVVTLGLLNSWPIDRISEAANLVATHVCSQTGAVPELPESLLVRFRNGTVAIAS